MHMVAPAAAAAAAAWHAYNVRQLHPITFWERKRRILHPSIGE